MDLVRSLGLFFLLLLRACLYILDRQLMKVFLATHRFENLHSTLKQSASGNEHWTQPARLQGPMQGADIATDKDAERVDENADISGRIQDGKDYSSLLPSQGGCIRGKP